MFSMSVSKQTPSYSPVCLPVFLEADSACHIGDEEYMVYEKITSNLSYKIILDNTKAQGLYFTVVVELPQAWEEKNNIHL